MAAIRKRGKYWHVQVIRKGYPRQFASFDTKAEAEQWSLDVESRMKRSVYVSNAEAERTTLEEAFRRYLLEVTARKRGAKQEESKIGIWLRRPISKRHLASLRSVDFARIRDDMRAGGYAENTIRLHLSVVSHLFETARKEWGMEALSNPLRLIKKPGNSRPRERRLRKGEEEKLLTACKASKADAMVTIVPIAIETGCRLGELLAMRWNRVDLHSKIVVLPDTKNGEQRVVPLSKRAIRLLRKLPRSEDGRVFGQWKNAWSFEHAWRRVVLKAGLDDFRFHDLRHEATSRFFEKGLNPMEVASITGHKTEVRSRSV